MVSASALPLSYISKPSSINTMLILTILIIIVTEHLFCAGREREHSALCDSVTMLVLVHVSSLIAFYR